MSKVLMIRHLPQELSFQDKKRLLQHFGAERVWQTTAKRNYVFASFNCVETAKTSLIRLHQLEIAQRRLVVEYSIEKEPNIRCDEDSNQTSDSTKNVKEFLKSLNAWNPSIDFYQPPPVHIKYKYPEINPTIAINIINALFKHRPLYIQTLHLMNKMSLDIPFNEDDSALQLFKETFKEYFLKELSSIPLPVSETESEMSSEEEGVQHQATPALVSKRKHLLPKTRKRPSAMLYTASLPKTKRTVSSQEEMFDKVTPKETKKITLVVHQDALQKPAEEPDVIGSLGTFQREEPPAVEEEKVEVEQPSITRKELLQNRLSYGDMKILPVFKNYHPGEPAMRLYIKNLAKTVTEQDVKRIYKHYVQDLPEEKQNGFDVRVMQEGKMKGQAFVTFPSVKIAETALSETNGFLLNDKPMVVQFARVASKKSVE